MNAEAYDSYLKGRHFFDLRTAASLEQAVTHFRRALVIDSTYARAYAGLADTYSIQAWTGERAPDELFALAAAVLLFMNLRMRGNIDYVLAALWALVAVWVKQSDSGLAGAGTAAWVALAIAVVLGVQTLLLRRRYPGGLLPNPARATD